jgi:hypothetical protein
MTVREKETVVIQAQEDATSVALGFFIVVMLAVIIGYSVYAWLSHSTGPSTYIERNSSTIQTPTPAPSAPTVNVTPAPVNVVPVPSAPAPNSSPAPSTDLKPAPSNSESVAPIPGSSSNQ